VVSREEEVVLQYEGHGLPQRTRAELHDQGEMERRKDEVVLRE